MLNCLQKQIRGGPRIIEQKRNLNENDLDRTRSSAEWCMTADMRDNVLAKYVQASSNVCVFASKSNIARVRLTGEMRHVIWVFRCLESFIHLLQMLCCQWSACRSKSPALKHTGTCKHKRTHTYTRIRLLPLTIPHLSLQCTRHD